MEEAIDAGLWGGIIGGFIGFMGGVIGTYFTIRNTNGPLERAFAVRMSVVMWAFLILFLAGLLFLPDPFRWLMWIPYSVLLPIGIRYFNKRQAELRASETKRDNESAA